MKKLKRENKTFTETLVPLGVASAYQMTLICELSIFSNTRTVHYSAGACHVESRLFGVFPLIFNVQTLDVIETHLFLQSLIMFVDAML